MTDKERIALRHIRSESKLDYPTAERSKMTKIYRRKGWLTNDKEALNLIKDGVRVFRENVAKRIITEHKSELFLNKCPKCDLITRTPQSRQCRYCGSKWHEIRTASFKLNASFQLTGGKFYITGELVQGKIDIGNFVDLTMFGINAKPEIKNVEFVLKKKDGTATEDIGLGTDELTESQKERLKEIGSFATPFDIVNSR